MTKEEKSEIKYRMKRLARKFCRRNDVYRSFDDVVAKLVERAYLSAYFLCLHENKNKIAELEKENSELKEQNRKLLESCEGATMMYEDLCKAKKIIKKLIEAIHKWDCENLEEVEAEAEQFLNSEVEK